MDEEELIVWQDVLDEIAAGRRADLACPHCAARPLAVEDSPTGSTRISCPSCRRFLEGRFGSG
ncbi:MAG TPA: hypothetical protein VNO33_06180 [Kofleriaceae bacterium]|nr:hypothetical protein [Kofleriaceae bacterium]